MDYPRFRAIERMAETQGAYRHHLVDIDEWRFAHELEHGTMRGAPDFRNMDAVTYADMYRAKGWTVVMIARTHRGYLGPRMLAAIERLACGPRATWTMVPVENDWTVVAAFSDGEDADPFVAMADGGRVRHAYHATPREALASIAEQGLVPNDGTRGFWPDGYDVKDRLFFCTTLPGAEYYADAIQRNVGPAAMLRFRVPTRRTRDERTDSGDGWHIAHGIAADALEILDDGRWITLKEAACLI